MSVIDEDISILNLPFQLEYAIINLDNEDLIKNQKEFFLFLKERKENNNISPLESQDISSRVFLGDIMPDAKSMIVFLFPYLTNMHDKKGNLSLYCMGADYHIFVKKTLENFVDILKQRYGQNKFYIQVDTGALNERFFAFYSGIGRLGINSMIFSSLYGSYVNIALIVTNAYLEEIRYEQKFCDKCMMCVKSCPGAAIKGNFTIDSFKCASFISQKKGDLNEEEKAILKKSKKIFGCDICQNICHFNNNVKTIPSYYDIIKNMDKDEINLLSNKKFKEKYGSRAFAFRGKSVIQRNLNYMGEDVE